ncbi:MAG: hypothetical protein QNJ72_02975 [Pleurocapsa sp. MO_226.B13]|nr:hypothetical protein [Pleurocapsa sp. MO_226.B13]
MILQHPQTIRHYQKITDGMVDLYRRRYSFEEIRLYMEGYIACLRNSDFIEQYHIHRLEEQALRFLRDPSNFELSFPQTQTEKETDFW